MTLFESYCKFLNIYFYILKNIIININKLYLKCYNIYLICIIYLYIYINILINYI